MSNSYNNFIKKTQEKIEQLGIDIKKDGIAPSLFVENSDYMMEVFINFDICNFTKYKTENPDWLNLLSSFINLGLLSVSEFTMWFWKFSGDALTFHKRIHSIYEIISVIKSADNMLEWLQTKINEENTSTTKVYLKAAVWVSGFGEVKKGLINAKVVNNIRFKKSAFGQEFVRENIDEGFRLCSCARADILAVDPKIVYILNLFSLASQEIDESTVSAYGVESKMYQHMCADFKKLSVVQADEIKKNLMEMNEKLFFIEFRKCKGVWRERPYPIFWYISDVCKKDFIYDEVIGSTYLCEHSIYHLKKKEKFDELSSSSKVTKNDLFSICKQVGKQECINSLISHLKWNPEQEADEETLDSANLYYMIATIVVIDGKDKGVLIFKRDAKRVHLKGVWDFTPVKHHGNFVEQLSRWFFTKLGISCELEKYYSFDMDPIRKSIRPLTLCNIYRNGRVHNGILGVVELKLTADNQEEILRKIKACALKSGYSDMKLVTYDMVKGVNSDQDIFAVDNVRIRALTPDEVSADSNSVILYPKYSPKFQSKNNETDYGISYLGVSIKEIFERRMGNGAR